MTGERLWASFPELEELLWHFTQDFRDDFGGPWGVVEWFVEHNRELARLVPAQVTQFLAEVGSEAEARALISTRSNYLPTQDGWGYLEWLEAVGHAMRLMLVDRA